MVTTAVLNQVIGNTVHIISIKLQDPKVKTRYPSHPSPPTLWYPLRSQPLLPVPCLSFQVYSMYTASNTVFYTYTYIHRYCQTNSERVWKLCQKKSNKDLFKDLRIFKLETQLGNNPEVFPRRKVKSSYRKSHIPENDQSCVLSPRISPGRSSA